MSFLQARSNSANIWNVLNLVKKCFFVLDKMPISQASFSTNKISKSFNAMYENIEGNTAKSVSLGTMHEESSTNRNTFSQQTILLATRQINTDNMQKLQFHFDVHFIEVYMAN